MIHVLAICISGIVSGFPVDIIQQSQQVSWISITDKFDREISEKGVVLLDWEGHIANPAIKLKIKPNRIYLPARIRVSSTCDRLIFNLFSEFAEKGSTKTLLLEDTASVVEFYVSILPDRDFKDEEHELIFEITNPNELSTSVKLPVHVIDQDRARDIDFKIHIDYSHDETGFFDDAKYRELTQQAADDWAYFFANMNLENVKVGEERSWIWNPEAGARSKMVTNTFEYQGFLLYAHGIRNPQLHSGGAASNLSSPQIIKGQASGLMRSGTISMEVTGNYNGLGWHQLEPDKDYWVTGNMRHQKHDYYSIVRHEIGHALIFHRVHPAFHQKMHDSMFMDETIKSYLGKNPQIDNVEHFVETVDPVSLFGVFGNEYGSMMPRKRWLITKFDLLVAQSVGYILRETTPFQEFQLEEKSSDF